MQCGGKQSPSSDAIVLERGRSVGRFLVLDALGSRGTVYRAYDARLRREVVLRSAGPPVEDGERPDVEAAQALARLSHPNLVAIYDVVIANAHAVLAMEYVPGQTLRSWLSRATGRHLHEVLAVFRQAAAGLGAAHQAGLVHHAFAPETVRLGDDGRVLVTSFGTQRHDDARTARYLAPEQHRGDAADARSDQYAFCVALWEAICGEPPFAEAADLESLVAAKEQGAPPWPPSVRAPRRLIVALRRGLSVDKDRRFESMQPLLAVLAHDAGARRDRVLALGVGSAVAAAAIVVWTKHEEQRRRCTGAVEHLAPVWNAERRHAIEHALLSTGLPYAEPTWRRVEMHLDGYARSWSEHYLEACEATTVRHEHPEAVMDLRMGCLRRAATGLASVVDVLQHADAAVVEKAVSLSAALPPLPPCLDVEALTAEVPPPSSPAVARAVEQARTLIARAAAEQIAGKHDVAAAHVAEARSRLANVDYVPAHAELAAIEGKVFEHLGQTEAAKQALQQALADALSAGSSAVAVTAASRLGNLLRVQHGLPEGTVLGHVALGLALGRKDALAEAEARETLGRMLVLEGQDEAAELETRAALELRQRVLGSEHPLVTETRNSIALSLFKQGKLDEAVQELRSGIALYEKAFGAEHPGVSELRNNLSIVLCMLGRFAEAEVEQRAALDAKIRNYGAEHPLVIASINNLGGILQAQGRLEEAKVQLQRALALHVKRLGPEHMGAGESHNNIGSVLHQQERFEDAIASFRRALAIYEKVLEPSNPYIPEVRINLAKSLAALGRDQEAREEVTRALAVLERAVAPDHPHTQAARSLRAALTSR